MRNFLYPILLFKILTITSCVTQKKYNLLQNKYDFLITETKNLNDSLNTLVKIQDSLQKEIAYLKTVQDVNSDRITFLTVENRTLLDKLNQSSEIQEKEPNKKHTNPFWGLGSASSSNSIGKSYGKNDHSSDSPPNGLRRRLTDPNLENLNSDHDVKIHLKLFVDNKGNVINAESIHSKTTTTDQNLIKKVISNVISQVKYEKKETDKIEIQHLTINIKAK